ncbi:hypothetical protein M011DRAFT_436967 [Sporormia fimetaria CBS 119925]|uniref:U three protein 23 n=1 Tax=Sporormia fimetaria CBS 119925 TaxID=1340428 RepID=A0A6A6VJ64_9PLEO|nr:hypothetical protein M011DRAFT_436967 [Sporormia fimetaria CBS 119925]
MRGKRAKKYRKLMHQYEINFNFRPPYQVLLDSDFLTDTANKKIDVLPRLQTVLGAEIKPMISTCCMRHLYTASPKNESLIEHAKTFERRRCGHHELETPLSSTECLLSCVDPKDNQTNKNRYVICTQDPRLRAKMREIPGTPIVYISQSVVILEPMNHASEGVREKLEREKFRLGLKGRRGAGQEVGEKRKREGDDEGRQERWEGGEGGDARPQKKRAKGPKGPNPLSVKKSKKKTDAGPTERTERRQKEDGAPHDGAADAAAGDEGAEAAKRKRRRKHKPKGDGGAAGDEEGDAP